MVEDRVACGDELGAVLHGGTVAQSYRLCRAAGCRA
jgi:hypothetical protein